MSHHPLGRSGLEPGREHDVGVSSYDADCDNQGCGNPGGCQEAKGHYQNAAEDIGNDEKVAQATIWGRQRPG